MVEGLGSLMREAVSRGRFIGFRGGNSEMDVIHLQATNDSQFIGEASVKKKCEL